MLGWERPLYSVSPGSPPREGNGREEERESEKTPCSSLTDDLCGRGATLWGNSRTVLCFALTVR